MPIAYVQEGGVSNCRGKRCKRKGAPKTILQKSNKPITKINRNFGKIAERFCIVFQMKRWERFQIFWNVTCLGKSDLGIFQEYQTSVRLISVFSTSYCCDFFFFVMKFVKSKHRCNRNKWTLWRINSHLTTYRPDFRRQANQTKT